MLDLKKVCPNCKKETVQKYRRDLGRLYKLTGEGDLPAKGTWLKSDALFKKYKAIPLNRRRQLSVAAVKGLQGYGLKHEKWNIAMVEDVKAYKKQRGKQKLSKVEKEKWPVGGYPVMKKMSTEYKRSIRRILQGAPSVKGLYAYSQALILRWYAEIAWRNDLVTVVVKGDGNLLSKKKGIYSVNMKEFKSSNKIGEIDVTLSKALSRVVDKYMKYRNKVELDHDYLIVNASGNKLSKAGLVKILNRLTKKYTGKAFGTRMIRIMATTHQKDALDKASKLASQMLHSLDTSQTYVRKDA